MERIKTFQNREQTLDYLKKHLKQLFEKEDISMAYERYLGNMESNYKDDDLVSVLCTRLTQGGSKIEVLSKDSEWKLRITDREE